MSLKKMLLVTTASAALILGCTTAALAADTAAAATDTTATATATTPATPSATTTTTTAVTPTTPSATTTAPHFTDVPADAWYAQSVNAVVEKGLMSGTSSSTFSPLEATSRGMAVTTLWRLEGSPTGGKATFKDVEANQWYSEAVAWAADNGIIKGYSDGTFGPEQLVTRQQLANIIFGYAQYKKLVNADEVAGMALRELNDSDKIAEWARTSMLYCVQQGLLVADANGNIRPNDDCTRAELAGILVRVQALSATATPATTNPATITSEATTTTTTTTPTTATTTGK